MNEAASRNTLLRDAALSAGLAIVTVLVFAQVAGHEFVNFDDTLYVTDNAMVKQGITGETVREALVGPNIGHWHPLTWYSLMLDYELFGLDASAFHITNLVFHVLNTLLLFVLLRWLTGAAWPSAAVAALFAIHPLHVEPVAWVSSRKDMLSAWFWLVTLFAYAAYAKSTSKGLYITTIVVFVLGLAAKPMVVTLPLTLLLFDYWPLRRDARIQRLLLEKAPFFALSAASAAVTYWAGQRGEAVRTLGEVGLFERLGNVPVHYALYLWKTVWPVSLAAPYPLRSAAYPTVSIALSVILIVAVSVIAWLLRRRTPYVLMGWLWFLITLLPVIGIVQIGGHAIADRYTYVPLIGLFVAVAWGVRELCRTTPVPRIAAPIAGVIVIGICAFLSWRQAAVWENSITLFRHAAAVTDDNDTAHTNWGEALVAGGRLEDAMEHFQTALEMNPHNLAARSNMGLLLKGEGHTAKALKYLQETVEQAPDSALYRSNLGIALMEAGMADKAVAHLERAVALEPNRLIYRHNLGNALLAAGRIDEAIRELRGVLETDAGRATAWSDLGVCYLTKNDLDTAKRCFESSLALNPDDAKTRTNYAVALYDSGEEKRALEQCQRALESDPNYEKAQGLLKFIRENS